VIDFAFGRAGELEAHVRSPLSVARPSPACARYARGRLLNRYRGGEGVDALRDAPGPMTTKGQPRQRDRKARNDPPIPSPPQSKRQRF
jgi:hypothetical protein